MSAHTATTLAYVRTSAGVVRVDPGSDLPTDVDSAELQRLVEGGAVSQAAETAPVPVPSPPAGGKSTGKRKDS